MEKDSVDILSDPRQSDVIEGMANKGCYMPNKYFSESWEQATARFLASVPRFARLHWVSSPETKFDIPYVVIGNGPHKIVVNSGIHGLEGYFGSAAQIQFLREFAMLLRDNAICHEYTFVLIHAINGWGMENRMREVLDKHGGLVDLNRNFGVDFSNPRALPQNPLYEKSHGLLLAKPDPVKKLAALTRFRKLHLKDGAWDAISYGQYVHPDGLFYGGRAATTENKMTLKIYDHIMADKACALTSIGLHTGLGRFIESRKTATSKLLVSHPENDWHSQHFKNIFGGRVAVETDERAANGPVLLGDLVDCLERRYSHLNIPVATADLEIGTGQFPIKSPIYKRMDMGDARYDLAHYGKINPKTRQNLTESWYPSSPVWRRAALENSAVFWRALVDYVNGKGH